MSRLPAATRQGACQPPPGQPGIPAGPGGRARARERRQAGRNYQPPGGRGLPGAISDPRVVQGITGAQRARLAQLAGWLGQVRPHRPGGGQLPADNPQAWQEFTENCWLAAIAMDLTLQTRAPHQAGAAAWDIRTTCCATPGSRRKRSPATSRPWPRSPPRPASTPPPPPGRARRARQHGQPRGDQGTGATHIPAQQLRPQIAIQEKCCHRDQSVPKGA
jgi:hypothetical protein